MPKARCTKTTAPAAPVPRRFPLLPADARIAASSNRNGQVAADTPEGGRPRRGSAFAGVGRGVPGRGFGAGRCLGRRSSRRCRCRRAAGHAHPSRAASPHPASPEPVGAPHWGSSPRRAGRVRCRHAGWSSRRLRGAHRRRRRRRAPRNRNGYQMTRCCHCPFAEECRIAAGEVVKVTVAAESAVEGQDVGTRGFAHVQHVITVTAKSCVFGAATGAVEDEVVVAAFADENRRAALIEQNVIPWAAVEVVEAV